MKQNLYILLFLLGCLQLRGNLPCALSQSALPDSLTPQPERQTATNDSTKTPVLKKSPRGAVIRAALFPGWGQWYNEKKFKALLVFGTEVGFISAAVWHNQQVVKPWTEKENYIKEFHINMRNQFVWYLVGTILYSMADAYVDAHLFDFDESEDLALRLYPDGWSKYNRKWWISLRKSF